MRYLILAVALAFGPVALSQADVSLYIGTPNIDIGINMPSYPSLVPVPGYPVYYNPQGDSNYFFYDGLYWVYQGDNWYASSWYNGPWQAVYPDDVPVFVLRVPLGYYRRPPEYFRGWDYGAPPPWERHWGHDWQERHHGWDHWDHRYAPAAAPLPRYQSQYAGDRYPHAIEQQRQLLDQHYHYQPHDAASRQHWQGHDNPAAGNRDGYQQRDRDSAPQQQQRPAWQERDHGDDEHMNRDHQQNNRFNEPQSQPAQQHPVGTPDAHYGQAPQQWRTPPGQMQNVPAEHGAPDHGNRPEANDSHGNGHDHHGNKRH